MSAGIRNVSLFFFIASTFSSWSESSGVSTNISHFIFFREREREVLTWKYCRVLTRGVVLSLLDMIRHFPPQVGGQAGQLVELRSHHSEGFCARELPQLALPRRGRKAV